MKKRILAAVMLCILFTFTACKKDSAEAEPIEEEKKESNFNVEETMEIEIEEGSEGAVGPN